ncbi:MAG TPA: hypothetical protein PKM19_10780, partial [Pseudomonadales bacterium]|nr:hypothetical protein [Pseudomonadales bacterium]
DSLKQATDFDNNPLLHQDHQALDPLSKHALRTFHFQRNTDLKGSTYLYVTPAKTNIQPFFVVFQISRR